MRRLRAAGPITSDKRISFTRAVQAGANLIRQVASISEADARVIAAREMNNALPARLRSVTGDSARRLGKEGQRGGRTLGSENEGGADG